MASEPAAGVQPLVDVHPGNGDSAAVAGELRKALAAVRDERDALEQERDSLEYKCEQLQSLLQQLTRRTAQSQGADGVADVAAPDSWRFSQRHAAESLQAADELQSWAPDAENDQSINQASPRVFQKQGSVRHFDLSQVPCFPERPHFHDKPAPLHPATQVVIFDGCPNDPYHPSSMPIYQTATFVQPSITEFGPYDYTRSGNPTRTALEVLVAKLECAHSAFAFSTGMGALTAITQLFSNGDGIIACSDLYGGMHRLLTQICERFGFRLRFVDTTDLMAVEAAIQEQTGTKLVHVESPSNPLMRITDIRRLSEICHRHGALLSVDATMMSPYLWQPLTLGVDIVMHSGTKFLSGHSDTMVGVVCTKTQELSDRVAFIQNAEGSALAPFDSWLTLRGLKTMALRVERQQYNAMKVAAYLTTVKHIKKLHYAGMARSGTQRDEMSSPLTTDRDSYQLHMSQAKGGGSVLSFETGDVRLSQRFVDGCQLFKLTVSFGSCNSLVEMPCLLSHASIPAEKRTLPADLVRLSVGIEDVADLLHDLQRAFKYAASGAKDVKAQVKKDMLRY
eukprot:TRINITY_DN70320_c0_g1_i1.p1 TRINITY_DN70320_c0_g1~~TRINITY_DN70320_c0_g1_i1.p1  ORF type:complete len:565 (+),score=183.47 TRINITY_DN70320_c0_g1_i1:90-1784(+)